MIKMNRLKYINKGSTTQIIIIDEKKKKKGTGTFFLHKNNKILMTDKKDNYLISYD